MDFSEGLKQFEKEIRTIMRWGVFVVSVIMFLGILLVILLKNS